MDHGVLDGLVGGRVGVGVRDLGRDIRIVIRRSCRLVVRTHDEQNVGVREATLLELNDVKHGNNFPENLLLQQIVQELLQLDVEDAGSEVRTVNRCLVGEKLRRDLRPLGIAGKRDKIVRRGGVCSHNGHCILVQLHHKSRSTNIA